MDELQSKLFWHLLPQCSNSLLLHIQDKFGALPRPEDFLVQALDWAPRPLAIKVEQQLNRPSKQLEDCLRLIEENNIGYIERGSSQYPELLAEIPDPPAILYFLGSISQIHKPQIAIVGSRSCSRSGCRDAYAFASKLSLSGFAITSGLALGVDTSAHQGALEAGGITLAVTGCGLETIYPSRNLGLAEKIIDAEGLLLSEFPPGTPPRRQNFPQRNRIISGLSLATLVVEASERSGSLITARLALEQGREVMVIPGSIHDPLKRGCHRLIREGATLVQSVDQMVEGLSSLLGFQFDLVLPSDNKEQLQSQLSLKDPLKQLLRHIQFEPTPMDDLIKLTQLDTLELVEMLADLELQGLIEKTPLGVSRIS